MRDIIADMIAAKGDHGATVKELADELGTHPSNISGRLTELKRAGRIRQAIDAYLQPVVREGAGVLIAITVT